MKGIINTDNLLRAVLNKEYGLLPKGNVLSHVTVAQIPSYNKLLFFSDAAVIPRPALTHFDAMIRYDVGICRRMGIPEPRVALIHCTEKVNEKLEDNFNKTNSAIIKNIEPPSIICFMVLLLALSIYFAPIKETKIAKNIYQKELAVE